MYLNRKLLMMILLLGCLTASCFTAGCTLTRIEGPEEEPTFVEPPNTMHPSIIVDGQRYESTGMEMPGTPDESEIKKITSTVPSNGFPKKEGEVNFPSGESYYAKMNDGEPYVVVLIQNEWVKFIKSSETGLLYPGRYTLMGTKPENISWIQLKEDKTFEFNRHIATSYRPTGTYEVELDLLYLSLDNEVAYIFNIEGGKITLQEDLLENALIEEGAIFQLAHAFFTMETTDLFSTEELLNGMKLVVDEFSFPGATLQTISFVEEEYKMLLESYMQNGRGSINGVDPKNVLIVLSSFTTSGETHLSTLNPNATYEGYQWVLIRDHKDEPWRIDDQGY